MSGDRELGDPAAPHTYLPEHGVGDALQAHGALVGQVVEDVQGADGFRAALLVAEDEVDPLVQLARDKLAFQGLKEVTATNESAYRLGGAPAPSGLGRTLCTRAARALDISVLHY